MTTSFKWVEGMSVRDLRRLVWAKETLRLPDFLAELAERKVNLTLEEAHATCAEIYATSDRAGFFVLDSDEQPQKLCLPELPTCVKECIEATFMTYQGVAAMQRIVDLYYGRNLPETLTAEARWSELHQVRRYPVVTRVCRGCEKPFVLNVRTVAESILKHNLIQLEKSYEPATMCWECRKLHMKELGAKQEAEKTPRPAHDPKGLGKPAAGLLLTTIAEQTSFKKEANGNKRKQKKVKDVDSGLAVDPPPPVREQPQLTLEQPEGYPPDESFGNC
jgi:hypothetical protein